MGYFYRGKHHKPNKYYVKIINFIDSLPSKTTKLKKQIRIFFIKFEYKIIYLIDRWDDFYDRLGRKIN